MPTKTELDFIRMWFAVAKDGCLPAAEAHDYIVANDISFADHRFNQLVEKARKHHDGKMYRQLSPLGQDLIATAMHVGDVEILPDDGRSPNTKPAPIGTNLVDCRSCEGRGRVPVGLGPARDRTITELVDGLDGGSHDPLERLPGWDVTCTDCKGRGRVPVGLGRGNVRARIVSADSDEWTLIDSEETARSFVGKTVEVDAPRASSWGTHQYHGQETRIKGVLGSWIVFEHDAMNWATYGNVRVRIVEGSP